jgi:uncharacterized radical SAM superfamily Fe-S cluster-containing enzyme
VTISAIQSVRNHIFHEVTRSLCPECRRLIDAQVLIRDDAVYLRKHCPEHGWHEALVSSSADWYLDSLKYNKPGAIPNEFTTSVEQGCPFDCGLCPEHQQHTCVALIEITTRCNLTCGTCFADAGSGYDLSLEQVEAMLDRLLETESRPEIVQISGGEPTIHPQILDILAAAQARNISSVMLNTNGLRLAQEPEFVRQLAVYQPIIYLQFDGLTAATYQTLRGHDLRAIKQQALDHLAEAGLHAVLVPTLVQGVNDGEIGAILRYGLEHQAVLGINYQPVTFAGRCLNHHDPLHRISLPDVLHALEAQTDGLFRVSDFRPVPCPHPTCSACTYAFVDGEQVIPLPRLLNVDDYLEFATNRTMPDLSGGLQSSLEALWSMAAAMGKDKTVDALNCVAGESAIPFNFKPGLSPEHFFAVQVHGFMDEHTFDIKRLMKCCVHQLLPDGRAVPFCAYNNLGYREQVKGEQQALSTNISQLS